MLEKLYCHTKPILFYEERLGLGKNNDEKCKPGNWYYYVTYKAATRDIVDKSQHQHTHFDIKETNRRMSKTILCLNLNKLPLYFWTKEQYRDNMIDKILLSENKLSDI